LSFTGITFDDSKAQEAERLQAASFRCFSLPNYRFSSEIFLIFLSRNSLFNGLHSRFQVGYAYIMYNQKIMSRLYFENIKFRSEDRLLHVFDAKGNNVLSGDLGVKLGTTKPFACRDRPSDGSVCWEWTKQAKLFINLDDKFTGISSDDTQSTRCYNFRWESMDENFTPLDCFNIGEERGQWYGGGLTKDADWQLERGSFPFAPFVSGNIR
jgi:myogenesis-regulating glycosidase